MSSLNSSKITKDHGITCEICSVHIPNDASMQAHLKGHKHLRNVAKQEEWKRIAKTSIYVGGIKNLAAAELALADYFSKFSAVRKITIDKTSQQYAIVELENAAVIDELVATKNHVINGVSVTVKPREMKSSVVHSLAKRSKQAEKENVMDESLIKSLIDCDTVEDQFSVLQERLQLTDDALRLRDLLCQLLESALHEVLPNCEIKQFGSSANGFGNHDCDLDLTLCYTEVHPEVLAELLSKSEDENMDCDSLSCVKTTSGNLSPALSDVLSAVAEVIKQCVPDCHKVKSILTARLPVIRFYHKASKMRCDLSLSNYIAVRNTEYLRACSRVLPNFRPLVYAVRLWMKHWELAGGLHTNGPRVNNYAVTLMVLFYLQHHGFLPTLQNMRLNLKEKDEMFINGINCSFSDHVNRPETGKTPKLSELFLGFFTYYSKMEFSKKVLDLSTTTVLDVTELESSCPQTNNGCEKPESPRTRPFRVGPLNIRDPFELQHNVAGNVNEKHLKIMIKCIRNAALATKMLRYSTKGKPGEHWGILNLLIDHHHKEKHTHQKSKLENVDFKLQLKRPDANNEKWNPELVASLLVTILRDVFLISFSNETSDRVIDFQSVDSESADANGEENDEKDTSQLCNGEGDSRKRKASTPESCGLCKRVKLIMSSPAAEHISAAVGTSNTITLPFTSTCVATHKVWEGRRKARRHLTQTQNPDVLELEKQVSKLLLSDSRKSSPSNSFDESGSLNDSVLSVDSVSPPLFKFSLSLTNEGSDFLNVSVHPESSSSEFATFFHHLEVFLPGFILKCVNR